jgi:hypothetical protein
VVVVGVVLAVVASGLGGWAPWGDEPIGVVTAMVDLGGPVCGGAGGTDRSVCERLQRHGQLEIRGPAGAPWWHDTSYTTGLHPGKTAIAMPLPVGEYSYYFTLGEYTSVDAAVPRRPGWSATFRITADARTDLGVIEPDPSSLVTSD